MRTTAARSAAARSSQVARTPASPDYEVRGQEAGPQRPGRRCRTRGGKADAHGGEDDQPGAPGRPADHAAGGAGGGRPPRRRRTTAAARAAAAATPTKIHRSGETPELPALVAVPARFGTAGVAGRMVAGLGLALGLAVRLPAGRLTGAAAAGAPAAARAAAARPSAPLAASARRVAAPSAARPAAAEPLAGGWLPPAAGTDSKYWSTAELPGGAIDAAPAPAIGHTPSPAATRSESVSEKRIDNLVRIARPRADNVSLALAPA